MGKGNWKCQVSVSTSDNTNTSMKIKASCVWDSNDWSYNMNGITGWVYINGKEYEVYSGSIDCSSGNTKTLGSKTVTINKNHSSQSISCYAKIKSTSTYSSGTETSGTTKKTVSAKPSYSVSYNGNGATSGVPGGQTKWYGENISLNSSTPSKTGHTFNGWSGSDGNVYWPNGTYSGNSALTLTARWNPNTYSVSYNGNGATSGVPGGQTKTYGQNLTLSSSQPSRQGYTFNGWSGSDGNVYWPNGTYSGNSALTLTARWNEITYTISYNANGGSGAPGNQTKRYTQNLTLSSTKPTLTNYNFKGWSTYKDGPIIYYPGSTYSNNANITLWAVWELAYVKPRITNFNAYRCTSDGTPDENGTYIKVVGNWATDKPVGTEVSGSSVKIKWGLSTASSLTEIDITPTESTTSKSIDEIIGDNNVDIEKSYVIQIYVNDVMGHNETSKYPIPSISFPIDIKKYGKGIAFGGVAKEDNIMDVNFKARFNQGQKMWRTDNTSNTNMWHYLGQFQINEQGNYVHIKIFGGAGQNAEINQNMFMDITMKKGYQNPPSNTKYVNVVYNVYAMNDSRYNTDNVKVKAMCHTIGYVDVYVYFAWPYSTIRYTVDGEFDSFIRGTQSESSSEPTEGVEQPCIGGVVPILYNGDLTTIRSFRIPKNGTSGYGLTNSDGASIIRDFNNKCVTVDATGGELYLGYQNTTRINFMNCNAFVNADGSIYPGADNNGGAYFDQWGNIIAKTALSSGKWCIQNNGKDIMRIDWGSGYVTFRGNTKVDGEFTVTQSLYNDHSSIRSQYIYNNNTVTNAPNFFITSNGWFRRTTNTSLFSHKMDIKLVEDDALNPERLYNLDVKQFKYKKEYQPSEYDIRYNETLIGFIAEDVEKIYPIAADYEYDIDKNPDEETNKSEKNKKEIRRTLINWNERYLIPPMLKLIQNHKKEIDELKIKMAALEQCLSDLENKGGN